MVEKRSLVLMRRPWALWLGATIVTISIVHMVAIGGAIHRVSLDRALSRAQVLLPFVGSDMINDIGNTSRSMHSASFVEAPLSSRHVTRPSMLHTFPGGAQRTGALVTVRDFSKPCFDIGIDTCAAKSRTNEVAVTRAAQ